MMIDGINQLPAPLFIAIYHWEKPQLQRWPVIQNEHDCPGAGSKVVWRAGTSYMETSFGENCPSTYKVVPPKFC